MAETEQVGTTGLQKVGRNAAGATGGAAGTTPVAKVMAMAAALQKHVMALPASKRNTLFASVAFLTAVFAGLIDRKSVV